MSDFDPTEVEQVAQGAFPEDEVIDFPMKQRDARRQMWYIAPNGEKYFLALAKPVLGGDEPEPGPTTEWWLLNAGEALDLRTMFTWMSQNGLIGELENWGFPVSFKSMKDMKRALWYGVNPALKKRRVGEAADAPPAIHQQAPQFAPDFIQFVKSLENPDKVGWDASKRQWLPHPSPEGGRATIAYGHKLKPGEEGRFERGISEQDAERLLAHDLATARQEVHDYILKRYKVRLTLESKVEEMLTEFAFNLGSLGKFPKFVDAVLHGRWDEAYRECGRSYRSKTGERIELKSRNDAFRKRYFGGMVKEDEEPQVPIEPEPVEPQAAMEPEPEPEPEFDPEEVENLAMLRSPIEDWTDFWDFKFLMNVPQDNYAKVWRKEVNMPRVVNPKNGRYYDTAVVYLRAKTAQVYGRTAGEAGKWGMIDVQWVRFVVKFMRQEPDPENQGKLQWKVYAKGRGRKADQTMAKAIMQEEPSMDGLTALYKKMDAFMNAVNDTFAKHRRIRTPVGLAQKLAHNTHPQSLVIKESEEFDPEEVEALAMTPPPFERQYQPPNVFLYWMPDPKRPGKRIYLGRIWRFSQDGRWRAELKNRFPAAYRFRYYWWNSREDFELELAKHLAWERPKKPDDPRFKFKVSAYDPQGNSTTFYIYLNGRKPLLLGYIRLDDRGWFLVGIHDRWFSNWGDAWNWAHMAYAERPVFKNPDTLLNAIYAGTTEEAHRRVMQMPESFDPEEVEQIAATPRKGWRYQPRPERIHVASSWGDCIIDDQGHIIENGLGDDPNEFIPRDDWNDQDRRWVNTMQNATRFDVDEWENYWQQRIEPEVDILDIGFWSRHHGVEMYIAAEDEWRSEQRRGAGLQHESKPFGWFNLPDTDPAAEQLAEKLAEDFDPEEVEKLAKSSLDMRRAVERRVRRGEYSEWEYDILTDDGRRLTIGRVAHDENWQPFQSWANEPNGQEVKFFPGAADAIQDLFQRAGYPERWEDLWRGTLTGPTHESEIDPEEVEQMAQQAHEIYIVDGPGVQHWGHQVGDQWLLNSAGQLLTWRKPQGSNVLRWEPEGDSFYRGYETGANGLPTKVEYTWEDAKALADQGKDVHMQILMQRDEYPGERFAMWWLPLHQWKLEDRDVVWPLRLRKAE